MRINRCDWCGNDVAYENDLKSVCGTASKYHAAPIIAELCKRCYDEQVTAPHKKFWEEETERFKARLAAHRQTASA